MNKNLRLTRSMYLEKAYGSTLTTVFHALLMYFSYLLAGVMLLGSTALVGKSDREADR